MVVSKISLKTIDFEQSYEMLNLDFMLSEISLNERYHANECLSSICKLRIEMNDLFTSD